MAREGRQAVNATHMGPKSSGTRREFEQYLVSSGHFCVHGRG
jgi:hypothetical protein